MKIIKNMLAAFCFIFISFLLVAVFYETIVTQELPTDSAKKLEKLSDKYSFLPKPAFGSGVSDDEEQENEKEKYDKGWYD